MEDAKERCPIFCIADIPPSTLELLLEATRDFQLGDPVLFSNEPMDTADWLVLMTSKDISSIHHGLSSPVEPFASPFIGMSIDDVTAWFNENIAEPEAYGYQPRIFMVLDWDAVDEGICTIVSVHDEGEGGTLRCDFTLALSNACMIEVDGTIQEGSIGSFSRTGMTMTKDNYQIAESGGMYLVGMEVKIDEH